MAVFVSATTRPFGPGSGDLGVGLGFGQLRLEGGELARVVNSSSSWR
jgi:hypothetical protein